MIVSTHHVLCVSFSSPFMVSKTVKNNDNNNINNKLIIGKENNGEISHISTEHAPLGGYRVAFEYNAACMHH